MMANIKAIWNTTEVECIRDSVCTVGFALNAKTPVAMQQFCANPQPAGISLLDIFPEAATDGLGARRAMRIMPRDKRPWTTPNIKRLYCFAATTSTEDGRCARLKLHRNLSFLCHVLGRYTVARAFVFDSIIS